MECDSSVLLFCQTLHLGRQVHESRSDERGGYGSRQHHQEWCPTTTAHPQENMGAWTQCLLRLLRLHHGVPRRVFWDPIGPKRRRQPLDHDLLCASHQFPDVQHRRLLRPTGHGLAAGPGAHQQSSAFIGLVPFHHGATPHALQLPAKGSPPRRVFHT